jgi:alkanesulfonate monooxygenase SsuD/methylene tetrahydromethanopterin reductase-like flavin-dependent oxidoreductase (luciferase family)
VTWSGKWRSPLDDQVLNPPIPPGNVPVWVGVGGSPESVVRAARYGLPLMLAVIGGHASRFAPYADLHRRALEQYGFDPQPVGLHSTGLIADTDEAAVAIQWPAWEETMTREGLRRGWAPPTYDRFLAEVASGSIYAGAPETMAPRIAESMRILGATRFDFAYAPGHVSHEHRMRAIELLGREVVPQVRELLASRVELVETSPTRNAG